MKNIIIIGLIAFGLYYFYPKNNSASSIADGIYVDGNIITYNDESFTSKWTSSRVRIEGFVRKIDKVNMKTMPIITTSFVITTGDYSNSEVTEVNRSSRGYSVKSFKPNKEIKGSITVYNIIPYGAEVQIGLDNIKEGDTISLLAKMSSTGELTGERSKLSLSSFKTSEYVSTKMVKSNEFKQYIAIVDQI